MATRRRRPTLLLAVAAVVVALVALPALLPSLNPFREQTKDRSQPVLIKSLENLSDYHAATANMQVVVDVEKDTRFVPRFIKGERTLFVAAGTVDAAVDFSGLSRDKEAVKVSGDRRSVALMLPAPKLTAPRIDPNRTRVYDRDRGVLDRVEDAVSDRPGDEQPLYQLAEDKLAAAAAADPQLMKTAERNTRAMLEGMMRGLGFELITIAFRPPQV
jgi:hypothetical protein